MFDTLLQGQRKAYMQINIVLCDEGKSFADFPQMEQLIENDEENDYMILEETMEVGTKQYEQLNAKQKEIVDLVLNRLDTNNHNNNCIYIDGPGGSGKTFIYTTTYYLAKIRINMYVQWLLRVLQRRYCQQEKQFIKHLDYRFHYLLIHHLILTH